MTVNLEELLEGEHRELVLDIIENDTKLYSGTTRGITAVYEARHQLKKAAEEAGLSLSDIASTAWRESFDMSKYRKVKKPRKKKTAKDEFVERQTSSSKAWPDYNGGSGQHSYEKCHVSHPLLTFEGVGEIQGASCYTPRDGFDIYIRLCLGARMPDQIVPWGPQHLRYAIVDQQAPKNKEEFDRLIDWTIEQMKAGKRVHVGCIGGHGRTGLFLSVLTYKITGNEDSTAWVRENYCKKAVESHTQVEWLFKHYGIKRVTPKHGAAYAESQAKTPQEKNAVSKMSFGSKESSGAVMALAGFSVWGETKLS